MNKYFWQILFGCTTLVVSCSCDGIAIFGPNVIHPNRLYNVAITNSLQNNDARLSVSITSENNATIASKNSSILSSTVIIRRRSTKLVTIKVGSIPKGEYTLDVHNVGGSVTFSKTVLLQYASRTMSIFVQTDKPVYIPGELLRFRIVFIDIDTKPVLSLKSLIINVKDSEEISIKQWNTTKLHYGVFESAMVLPGSPNLGNWEICVTANDGLLVHEKKQRFLLKEYVLPTFNVSAVPSELLLIGNKKVSLTIKSFYTFGDPVKGTAKIDLYLPFALENPEKNQSISKHIEGTSQVVFHLLNEIELRDDDSKFAIVTVNFTVTEDFTNREVYRCFRIPVYRYPFDITSQTTVNPMKPDVTRVEISVREHNGLPVSGHTVQLNITSSLDDTTKCSSGKHCSLRTEITTVEGDLDASGVVSFETVLPETVQSTELKINVGPIKGFELNPIELDSTQATDENDNLVLTRAITVVPSSALSPQINGDYSFVIRNSYRITHYWYVVVCQDKIVTHGFFVGNRVKHVITVKITAQMAPKSNIIVFTTIGDFLHYNSYEIKTNTFRNELKISADSDQYSPSQDIKITTDTAKDSYVAYHAIDVSALHVGHEDTFNGFGFTKQDVLDELDLYMNVNESFSLIGSLGFFVESSGNVVNGNARFARFAQLDGPQKIRDTIILRTYFPEVFLWHNISMQGQTSRATIKAAPESITSWQLTGFALSPTAGLGIMEDKVEFVVKKPFYIIVSLPYSIKRNEISRIQVTIFSFLGSPVATDVWLYSKNDEIEFVDKSSSDPKKRKKTIMVPANYGQQTSFLIKAKKLGNIAIKIEAKNMLASDGLERWLLVTPESHLQVRNEARFIEHENHMISTHKIRLNIPQRPDEGSVNISISATDKVLSPIVENLQSLFEKPTGCGEQSMLKFVPNVVILDYLEESGTNNPQLKTKAINFLVEGYANQLRYKLNDSSFAIFPNLKGGTFLTALVAKSFKIAGKYINVDKTIVVKAFDWLASIQDPDGLFPEVGNVYNTNMQGGLYNKKKSLSAFVAIAFLENTDIAQKYNSAIRKTINYLAANLDHMDQYELALTTYAFTLSNHPRKNDTLKKLMSNSIFDDVERTRYWPNGDLSVETTSYALLSFLKAGYNLDAVSIARWLISKRKNRGVYHGTQATFVGLKALANFASIINPDKTDLGIKVSQKIPAIDWHVTFSMTNTGSGMVRQLLRPDSRLLEVEISGRGYGLFQVTYMYNYNINIDERKKRFNVTVQVLPKSTKHKQYLQVCTVYIPPEAYNVSGMALVEVFLPSGYEVDKGSLVDLWKADNAGRIMKSEQRFGGTSLVVYYNNIDTRIKCFTLSASRVHLVARQLPAYVIAYEYDNEENFGIHEYQGTVLQPCDICDPLDCEDMNCNLANYSSDPLYRPHF